MSDIRSFETRSGAAGPRLLKPTRLAYALARCRLERLTVAQISTLSMRYILLLSIASIVDG